MNTARQFLQAIGLASEPLDGTPDPVGTYASDVQPPARSREPLTVQRAMGLPAVFRSIQLLAGMGAQCVLEDWRGDQLAPVQSPLVVQPDPFRTADSFVERFIVNLATDGNNFTWKRRGGPNNDLLGLVALNPFTVQIVWREVRGRRVKRFVFPHPDTGRQVECGDADMIHTWGLEVPGLTRGLGPIGHTRAALTGAIDTREYADRWFREEAVDGVLTTDQPIDSPAAKNAKKLWYTKDPDDPAGPRLRVMGKGLRYEPIMLRPAEAQWLEAQNMGVLDVARIFGVPPEYLAAAVDGTAMTYSNLTMIDAQLLRTTLFPIYLRKIENAITQVLPRGHRARFRTDDLLRPDAMTRAQIDAIYLQHDVYDAAHIHRRDRLHVGARPATPTRQESVQ